MKRTVLNILLLVSALQTLAQKPLATPTVQDCAGAIPVCQSIYTTTSSYTGHGNIYPEIHNNGECPLCMDGEKNDVFYIFTVQTSGRFRFKLTPNNLNNDYDWSLFNMTNADCSEIYTGATELQVSCNSYGVQGSNGATGISTPLSNSQNCNGPGTLNGPAWNMDIQALAGQTYILNISNWSSTAQSGYTLDFSESTAQIFDNVPPMIDSIQQLVPCQGSSSLFLRFSENVKCPDIYQHPEKFTLTGPGGSSYTISAVENASCASGGSQAPSCVLTVSPLLNAGSYTLTIAGDIRDLCDNVAVYEGYPFTLSEINAPACGAGNDTTVNNGAIINLHGQASGGASPYTYHWEPAAALVNPDLQQPTTINMGASTLFTLSVTDNAGCHATDEVLVTVIGGPLSVSANASPATICAGDPATLHAIGSGGSGNFSWSWSSSPAGFTSTLQNPTVYPTVNTTYTVQVNDGFSTVSAGTSVNVNPKPAASAGGAFSIPYGTNASLNGSASGGTGSYAFHWTSLPPGYSANTPAPTFTNLQQTTLFVLTATDQNTGCVSEPAQVTVTVTGSPLAVNPMVSENTVCEGTPVQLFAMAGGGSGSYSYAWTSNPPGFTSTLADPMVTPLVPTVYNLNISDGFNTASGSVVVNVNPAPDIRIGPADTIICIYDSLVMNAENPGSTYYWSNGATSQSFTAITSGIGFDIQEYKVKVTTPLGCSDSASVRVVFSFGACTGTEEQESGFIIGIYPNPGNGNFRLYTATPHEPLTISVNDLTGRHVLKNQYLIERDVKETPLHLEGFPAGAYFVRISGTGTEKTLKIFKY